MLDGRIGAVFARTDVVLQAASAQYRDLVADGGFEPAKLSRFLSYRQTPRPELVAPRPMAVDGIVRYSRGNAG